MPDNKQPAPAPPSGRIRLPQRSETPLTSLSTPFGTAMYLYARSNDSVHAQTVGQDYLAFRYDPLNLAFAVCDGVGQSFMGDLAARLLGEGLIEWLWALDTQPESTESFSQATGDALNALTVEAGPEVAAFNLPASLPPILVQALEMQRDYGSESMFVAGRLALDGASPWAALCWLGDSPVAAIDIDGELVDLGPKGHTSERWNARTGVKGEVHTWVGDTDQVARVAGYTDGLALSHVPTDADLARLMEAWAIDPPGDDASLFDVRLAPSPATTGQEEAPAPEDLEALVFDVDTSRPIVVEDEPRTPVRNVEPIPTDVPESSAVEGWRPLQEEAQPTVPKLPTAEDLQPEKLAAQGMELISSLAANTSGAPTLSAQQQAQMWQQAALLGLTSATLAMLMVERLAKQQTDEGDES
jgi:hypothetical protein